jgi:ABC-type transport system substrate-binding protein
MFPTGIVGLTHSKNDYPGGDNQWGCHSEELNGHLDFMLNSTMDQIQYHCYEAQSLLNDLVPYIHVLYQNDVFPMRMGMEGMVPHPTGLVSDGNPFTNINYHNTTNMPGARNGKEWVMRYFKGVNQGNPEGIFYYDVATARISFVDRLLWESLVVVNSTNHVVPWLAENFTVADDGMQFNFTLRDGIKFHDGTDLTPEDVKFSFDYCRASENQSAWGGSLIYYIDNCEVDGDTIIFNMREFDAWGIYTFADLVIFPKHIFETVPYADPSWYDLTNTTTKIGTGPFKFNSVEASDNPLWWKFDKFTDYWYAGGLDAGTPTGVDYPRMDHFTIRVITYTSATVAALLAGEVDCDRYSWSDLTVACEPYIGDELDVESAPSIWRKILWVNNMISPLSDVVVRKAIAYAFDYQAIVDTAESGYGVAINAQWLPQAVFGSGTIVWNNAAANIYSYNAAKAKQLLDAAGYIDVDNDGVCEIPGTPTSTFEDDGVGFAFVEIFMLCMGAMLVLAVTQRRRK